MDKGLNLQRDRQKRELVRRQNQEPRDKHQKTEAEQKSRTSLPEEIEAKDQHRTKTSSRD